jgi:hypothetical protein
LIDLDNFPPSRQPVGSFPYRLQQPPRPLGERPITPRENQRRLYMGEKPMWMPVWLVDSQYCWPDVVLEHPLYEMDGFDWWGTEWVSDDNAGGMMVKPGTRVLSDISNWRNEVKIPDLDSVDFESDAKLQIRRYDPDRMHLFHCPEGLFERLHELMPFDEAILSFYDDPDAVQDFFSAVCDFKIDLISRVVRYYAPIDYIVYSDDWGTQRSGFFSNEMFREIIMPQTKRLWDWIHSQGLFLELHSCGLTQQYIDEIIEMGCDAWAPQEINDFEMLTAKYADRITLVVPVAGIENARTEAEARSLVRTFIDKYAPRGRIMARTLANPDPAILEAAYDELYTYSSRYYAGK